MKFFKPETIYLSEDAYCPPDPDIRSKKNFFIISGCSGAGKSSLMKEIASRGFRTINEPGRQVVKEQNHIEGDALPGKDWRKFIEFTISRTMYQYNSLLEEKEIIFFDRAIVDQISWDHLKIEVPLYLMNAARKYRFNEKVFFTPPWKEIYKTDNERKHSYEDSLVGYDSIIKSYETSGYKLIHIPKVSVSERADFVIESATKIIKENIKSLPDTASS